MIDLWFLESSDKCAKCGVLDPPHEYNGDPICEDCLTQLKVEEFGQDEEPQEGHEPEVYRSIGLDT